MLDIRLKSGSRAFSTTKLNSLSEVIAMPQTYAVWHREVQNDTRTYSVPCLVCHHISPTDIYVQTKYTKYFNLFLYLYINQWLREQNNWRVGSFYTHIRGEGCYGGPELAIKNFCYLGCVYLIHKGYIRGWGLEKVRVQVRGWGLERGKVCVKVQVSVPIKNPEQVRVYVYVYVKLYVPVTSSQSICPPHTGWR